MTRKKIFFKPLYCFKIKGTDVVVKMRKVKYQPIIDFTTNSARTDIDSITNLSIISDHVHLRIKSSSNSIHNYDFLLIGKILNQVDVMSNQSSRDHLKRLVANAFHVDPSHVRRILKKESIKGKNPTHDRIREAYSGLLHQYNKAVESLLKNEE